MTDKLEEITGLRKIIRNVEKEHGEIGANSKYVIILNGLLDFIETHTVGKNGVVTYKPGVLHVFVAKHRGSEAIHSAEVEISNDTIEVYLATDEDGMCKKKLPGGNYTVTATHREKNESQRITVDGKTDLSLYIK